MMVKVMLVNDCWHSPLRGGIRDKASTKKGARRGRTDIICCQSYMTCYPISWRCNRLHTKQTSVSCLKAEDTHLKREM